MYTHSHTHTHTYTHTHMHMYNTRTLTCVHAHAHTHTYALHKYVQTNVYMTISTCLKPSTTSFRWLKCLMSNLSALDTSGGWLVIASCSRTRRNIRPCSSSNAISFSSLCIQITIYKIRCTGEAYPPWKVFSNSFTTKVGSTGMAHEAPTQCIEHFLTYSFMHTPRWQLYYWCWRCKLLTRSMVLPWVTWTQYWQWAIP